MVVAAVISIGVADGGAVNCHGLGKGCGEHLSLGSAAGAIGPEAFGKACAGRDQAALRRGDRRRNPATPITAPIATSANVLGSGTVWISNENEGPKMVVLTAVVGSANDPPASLRGLP
jgi:hypothetical protein